MLYVKRKAFTMIELVFVIVILGILAAVAVPRFTATRDDAQVSKGRSDISAIRSGIVTERQGRLFRGQNMFISRLDANVATNTAGVMLFDNNGSAANTILQYGIATGAVNENGHWIKTGPATYDYRIMGVSVRFSYVQGTGTFDCAATVVNNVDYCAILTD